MFDRSHLAVGTPLGVTVVASAGESGRVTTRLVGRAGDCPAIAIEQTFFECLEAGEVPVPAEPATAGVDPASHRNLAAEAAANSSRSLARLLLQSWRGPDASWTCMAENAGTACAWLGLLPIGAGCGELAFAYRLADVYEVITADRDHIVEEVVLQAMTAFGAVSLTTLDVIDLDTPWAEEPTA